MGSISNTSQYSRWTVIGILLQHYHITAFLPTPIFITPNTHNNAQLHLHHPNKFSTGPSIITNVAMTNVEEREADESVDETIVTPVFDFTGGKTSSDSSEEEKAKSLASFDRIDDAIMGGISLSSLKDGGVGKPYATWSGICRVEGGGFCGFRTLPFKQSLNATGQDGIYIDCRLTSDDEPQRRVWKMTMRTEANRASEIVYQAEFDLRRPPSDDDEEDDNGGWSRVKVPFDSFRLVRGPRLVPDMPNADVSKGIYQVGISLSKFVMGEQMTELPGFRPGYFELQVRSIGLFKDSLSTGVITTTTTTVADEAKIDPIALETVSKADADQDRPVLFKIISPVFKLLFSERSKRRRTATKILMETRGWSRAQTIRFGVGIRRKGSGFVPAVGKTMGLVGGDAARWMVKNVLKVILFYPLRLILRVVRGVRKLMGMRVNPPLTE